MTLMTLACAEGKSWQSSWGTLWENGLMAGFAIFCSDSMIYLNLFNTISPSGSGSWTFMAEHGQLYDETQQSFSRQVANKQSVRVVKHHLGSIACVSQQFFYRANVGTIEPTSSKSCPARRGVENFLD